MKLNKLLTILCFVMLVLPVYAQKSSKTGNVEELKAGSVQRASLELGGDFGMPTKAFSFRVPKNAYAIRISLSDAEADLDLLLSHGSRIDEYSSADISSEEDTYNDSIFLTRQSDSPLETGIYYVSVVYQYDYLPRIDGRRAEKIDFGITYEIIKAEPEVTLRPGIPSNMILKPENGMFAVAAVDIPSGTDNFRIDVFNTDADIDIFASMRTAAKSRAEALYAAESMLGSESLIIRGYPDSRLMTGRYYISLIDQLAKDLPQELSILVTLGEQPSELLTDLPKLPDPEDSFDAALLSTVEIISDNGKGSGCIVSKNGYVITNWHVIKGADGAPSGKIVAAVSLSVYSPPKELFSARMIDYDQDLDLALLKIDAGRYDQSLPYNYEFPYFSFGDPSRLRIGQPIGVIGYPEVGGTGSRTSVTFTSGIVSGFEAGSGCTLIKTDALIGSGNSGGAVINAYNELLGIPGYIMDINNDKMGYVYPISCLPEDWSGMIERANS